MEVFIIFLIMTEVFIAAVSTTKFQLNEEDLEYYRDEKAKEIQEVRSSLLQLHEFDKLTKKERPLANHALLWKNLLILSKILGFQSDFFKIDQLRIPQAILTQQLWCIGQLFTIKHYNPRTTVGNWETAAQKYYILMEGIVEKEMLRSSISKFEGQTFDLGQAKMNNNSRFKKNNKKRFARTDQQIPICLNSKRSQGRNLQIGGNYRSLTDVEMLEVNCATWKRYVNDFKRLQQEYLMNFIRKKMNLSLNFEGMEEKNQESQLSSDNFYSIITLQRKTQLQFTQSDVFLLYMGQMLITTPNYKVEISRGCVLNPAASQIFAQTQIDIRNMRGIAGAKNLSTIIKISVDKLQEYFKMVGQQKDPFIQLLRGLQNNRHSKKQQEKSAQMPRAQSLGSLKQQKVTNRLNSLQSQDQASRNISPSPNKLYQRQISQGTLKLRYRQKIVGLKSIENMVQKTAKAAELKHIQYLKKAHLSQDPNKTSHEENSLLPEYIFKDCMRNIQTKNQLLKQAVKQQRQKMKNQMSKRQNLLVIDVSVENYHKIKSLPSTDGSRLLKKKIKDIYIKTEGCEDMINLATSSQRPTASASYAAKKQQERETVGTPLKIRELSEKQLYSGFYKWYSGGLGVMKKVQTGKIRRIKLK